MNHRRFIIATPALLAAAVVLTSTEANAQVPPDDSGPAAAVPHDPAPPNYPTFDPRSEVSRPSTTNTVASADATAVEALQAGAAALGGAGIAFGGMWLYRRRQTHIA